MRNEENIKEEQQDVKEEKELEREWSENRRAELQYLFQRLDEYVSKGILLYNVSSFQKSFFRKL